MPNLSFWATCPRCKVTTNHHAVTVPAQPPLRRTIDLGDGETAEIRSHGGLPAQVRRTCTTPECGHEWSEQV